MSKAARVEIVQRDDGEGRGTCIELCDLWNVADGRCNRSLDSYGKAGRTCPGPGRYLLVDEKLATREALAEVLFNWQYRGLTTELWSEQLDKVRETFLAGADALRACLGAE